VLELLDLPRLVFAVLFDTRRSYRLFFPSDFGSVSSLSRVCKRQVPRYACGSLPRIGPHRNLLAIVIVYPTIHTSARCARHPSHIGDTLVRLWLRWHKLHTARRSPVSERKSGSSAKCHATFGGLISFLAAPRTVGSTPGAHCCTEIPVRVIEVSSLSGAPFICRSLFSTPSAGTSRVSDSVRSTLDRPRGICPESSATA
jgi:hypothetical protein